MDITYEPTFSGYPVNSDKERGLGCYSKGLGILQSKLESMTESHSKVLITGVVLRYPQDGPGRTVHPGTSRYSTKTLSGILKGTTSCRKAAGLRGKKKERTKQSPKHRVDPSITIVCEQHGEDKNPHAHVIIMLNGNAKRDPRDVQKRASRAWEAALGVENGSGLVHYCEKFHLLVRCISWLSATMQDSFHYNSYPSK